MKRIGILTRHCYPNYGSILQAFALQHALKTLGADVHIVDYIQEGDRPLGLVKSTLKVSSLRKTAWGRLAYYLAQTPTFLSMALTFRKHQKRLLNLTDEVHDGEGLQRVSKNMDCLVSGSDQVWNRITEGLDSNYFLSFAAKNKRSSYAASLGTNTPHTDDVSFIVAALNQMAHVSVREPTSVQWLNARGVAARSDVDPVILHQRDFWDKFAGRRRIAHPYILVYQLHHTREFAERLSAIQRKHSLPIVRVTPDWKRLFHLNRTQLLVAPEAFVALLRDASYVVTDSFHGTAFSLRLGTPLYVLPPGKYATRLFDMLDRVNLRRLALASDIKVEISQLNPHFDAQETQELLNLQARDSWAYLKQLTGSGT